MDKLPELELVMIRPTLADLPVFALPAGYALQWYRAGDEQHWLDIHALADDYFTYTLELYRREFGEDTALLAERQYFLLNDADKFIGTTTAWIDDGRFGAHYGRIHWVAIVPSEQGKGLAKPLLGAACLRLRELGHTAAFLVTSTALIPALNLYLSFGFQPYIRDTEDQRRWELVRSHLKYLLP